MANRLQLYKYKGDRCSLCALSVEEMIRRHGTCDRMFDFNHVDPAAKHPDYANLIRRVLSTEQLDEVDKCILLCKLCHAKVHAQNLNRDALIVATIGDREATQRIKGQIVFDSVDRTITFLTNEAILVHPYWLQIPDEQPRMLFGTELQSGQLMEYLNRLPTLKSFTVESWNHRLIMTAKHIEGRSVGVETDVRFPVISAVLLKSKGEKPMMWVRNGQGIVRDGRIIGKGIMTYEMRLPEAAGCTNN